MNQIICAVELEIATLSEEVQELTLDTLSLVGGGCDPYNML